jgi:hypothetical protein
MNSNTNNPWQTLRVAPTIGQEDSLSTVTVVRASANDNAPLRKYLISWKGREDWAVAFDAEIYEHSAAGAERLYRAIFPRDHVAGVREA